LLLVKTSPLVAEATASAGFILTWFFMFVHFYPFTVEALIKFVPEKKAWLQCILLKFAAEPCCI